MHKLRQFENYCSSNPKFKVLGPYAYEYLPFEQDRVLTLVALVHGNEIGGLNILLEVLKSIEKGSFVPQCRIRFILGNIPAYELNKRFIETDLNRSFNLNKEDSKEERRAKEIETYISGSTMLLDFHQTLEPSYSPFFIFNYEESNYRLAKNLASDIPIITFKSFSNGKSGRGLSSMANLLGASAITVETGEKGDSAEQTMFGVKLVNSAASFLESSHLQDASLEPINCFT